MTILKILFDPTVNHGWNGCAFAVYAVIICLVITAIKERH